MTGITFNGYSAGESRTSTHRVRSEDGGHSVVETRTRWDGGAFRLGYVVICQCGKKYQSKSSMERAWRSQHDHQKREVAKVAQPPSARYHHRSYIGGEFKCRNCQGWTNDQAKHDAECWGL